MTSVVAKNTESPINLQWLLYLITIAILFLALVTGFAYCLIRYKEKRSIEQQYVKTDTELKKLKQTITATQDDIAQKQSEINRLENDK